MWKVWTNFDHYALLIEINCDYEHKVNKKNSTSIYLILWNPISTYLLNSNVNKWMYMNFIYDIKIFKEVQSHSLWNSFIKMRGDAPYDIL
jgi:hypothetical protein